MKRDRKRERESVRWKWTGGEREVKKKRSKKETKGRRQGR
jgi:hypothetical protein